MCFESDNDYKMKRITVKQASKFETGNRTNLKRANSVCHYAYNEYKDICDNNIMANVMYSNCFACRFLKSNSTPIAKLRICITICKLVIRYK